MGRHTAPAIGRALERQRLARSRQLPDLVFNFTVDSSTFDRAIEQAITALRLWGVASWPTSRIPDLPEPTVPFTSVVNSIRPIGYAIYAGSRRIGFIRSTPQPVSTPAGLIIPEWVHRRMESRARRTQRASAWAQLAAYGDVYYSEREAQSEWRQNRFDLYGENSYDDGSLDGRVIDGELVHDAHEMKFTEEEKLAVTAKELGSIKRERRSRGVFEEDS